MRRAAQAALAAVLGLLAVGGLSGCGHADDGLTAEQRQSSDRLSEIAKKTDGDWDKLSPADRDFLLKTSYGNEQSARMLLLGAAGKIGGKAGGPPK